MLDRFRVFLDRPLDPSAGRVMLALAATILLGLAALFVLGAGESENPAASQASAAAPAARQPSRPPLPVEVEAPSSAEPKAPRPHRQDPQDEKGSSAAGRAAKAMRSHRVLQHVPYRRARLSVRLVGAHGARAVLLISAPTAAAARRGWRLFLRRYRDDGRAYVPRFQTYGGIDG